MSRRILVSAMLVAGLSAGSASATTITYSDFSDISGLTLNGATALIGNPTTNVNGDKVLRLTNNLSQGGSAFSTSAVSLASDASFSTAFQFQISNPMGISDADGQGADGLVFVVQTVANNVGGVGGGIGYQGIVDSVGVEFDTWDNGLWDDYNGNHVGVNLEGNIDSVVQTPVATRMNNGALWYAWVDYNGAADNLEVRLSNNSTRPTDALISHAVDLVSVLGSTNAFIGFTSGTGAAGGYHDILSWQFVNTFAPIDATVPEPATWALMAGGLLPLVLRRRRKSA